MTNTKAGTEMLDEALSRLNEASREIRAGVAQASTDWEKGIEFGDKARLAARTVYRSVRMHPWYYVGGAVASSLVVGLLIRRRPRTASV